MAPTLLVKRLTTTAKLPTRATPGSSGLDLYADAVAYLPPGQRTLIPTGIAISLPKGYEGQVRPRSGLALKHGVVAHWGSVDSDYRGDVGVILFNYGHEPFRVNHGDRIAQLIIAPVVMATPVEVAFLDETDRGPSGYGSSGR